MKEKYQHVYGPAMTLLCVIALVLSIILTAHSLSGMGLIGCGTGSSCDQVTGSRWSLLLGFVPIASLAVGAYLALLLCVLYLFFDFDAVVRKILWGLSVSVFFCCLWFIYLQAVKVKAFCPYCMSAHVCGIFTAVLAFLSSRDLRRKTLLRVAGTGAALAMAFMVFQMSTTPAYQAQTGHSDIRLPIPDAVASPVVGSVNAERTVALLYDYRCTHCRTIHGFLEDAIRHFGGEVAFVLCPTPLSPACNPFIPSGGEDLFDGSCDLARLALGLWTVDQDAFHEFDAWLFSVDGKDGWYPRTPAEAENKALDLSAGRSMDPDWVSSYLASTLELFGRTTAEGRGGIPRLVYGSSWVIPETDTSEGFIRAVDELLTLSP